MARRPTYPTFGSREYWHLVGGPEGAPLDQAGVLERLFLRYREFPEDRCPIPKRVAKGMVLELAKGLADQGEPLPDALISALTMALELPEDFPADPATFFAGADDDFGRRRQRDLAMQLDVVHLRENGCEMPLKTLERKLGHALGGHGPVRATLRKWRREPDYSLYVKVCSEGVAEG